MVGGGIPINILSSSSVAALTPASLLLALVSAVAATAAVASVVTVLAKEADTATMTNEIELATTGRSQQQNYPHRL